MRGQNQRSYLLNKQHDFKEKLSIIIDRVLEALCFVDVGILIALMPFPNSNIVTNILSFFVCVLLVFLGIQEGQRVHEKLEKRATRDFRDRVIQMIEETENEDFSEQLDTMEFEETASENDEGEC